MTEARRATTPVPRVLIVEDSAGDRTALSEMFEKFGFAPTPVSSLAQAREALDGDAFELVLLDVRLPDGEGHELLSALERIDDPEVVFVTGYPSVDSAVEALRYGANDYLTKPIDPKRLERIADGVRKTTELRGEVHALRTELRKAGRFCGMIGSSEPMQRVYDLIAQVAPTDSTVMILGETGTGKELAATAIHSLSKRAGGPFVPINCGALSPTLIESELFGHEKGSFTGADRMRRGAFESADGGTLFLDELLEMSPELQVKLLRVIETKRLTRLGGDRPIDVDVRVAVATNRDPHQAVKEGKLREDLLYRLLVFPIEMPPLREREDDIELLARFFVAQLNYGSEANKIITDAAIGVLRRGTWPGNVRELMHTIERAYIVSKEQITVAALPESLRAGEAAARRNGEAGGDGLGIHVGMKIAEAERRLLLATLESVGGDKKLAAKVLGVSIKTLYNRLREYRAS